MLFIVRVIVTEDSPITFIMLIAFIFSMVLWKLQITIPSTKHYLILNREDGLLKIYIKLKVSFTTESKSNIEFFLFYPSIMWFWVLISGSNKLQCYLVMNLIKLFWYLIQVERTVRNGNSISVDVIEQLEDILEMIRKMAVSALVSTILHL